MTPVQLIAQRDEITRLLPDISTIDLSSELVSTYLKLKDLLADTIDDMDESTSPNQVASLINSINASLKQLTEFQKELYGVQRQRAFEEAIHLTFNHGDKALKQTFLDLLETELEEL